MDAGTGQPRFGLVTSYDPNTHTAKVTLQPEGVQTGWLPILAQWMGNGWGIVAPLAVDDQVFVLPQEGNAEHGVIVGRCYSDQQLPPKTAPAGEMWLVHESGTAIKITSDGPQLIGHANVTATTPSLNTSGNVVVGTGATGSFSTPTGKTVTVQDGIIVNIY